MKPIIIEPKKSSLSNYFNYQWDELEVKKSNETGAGNGVFARVNLPVGTMIPILGKQISQAEFNGLEQRHKATHVWNFYKKNLIIDGDPKLNPQGLNIALIVNEPSKDWSET